MEGQAGILRRARRADPGGLVNDHPSDLWKEPAPGVKPIVFEMVRARGMETIHQKRPTEDAALCGLLPADSRRGRWTVYPKLPEGAAWCETCTIAAGQELVAAQKLSRTTMGTWDAWPFPNHFLKDKP